jgi:hypothetical protein
LRTFMMFEMALRTFLMFEFALRTFFNVRKLR